MKLNEKMKQVIGIDERLIEKYLEYNILGSIVNVFEEMFEEINDEDISKKFNELQKLIMDKREKLGETELNKENGENK